MNPRDFHLLATRLAQGSAAEIRTSMSRSYYAAFNVGAAILRDLGFQLGRGAAAHGEVVHCLANAGDKDVAALSAELLVLHGWRNRADYQLDKLAGEDSVTAKAVAGQAGRFIQLLDTAFAGPKRNSLRQSILTWRKANGYP